MVIGKQENKLSKESMLSYQLFFLLFFCRNEVKSDRDMEIDMLFINSATQNCA